MDFSKREKLEIAIIIILVISLCGLLYTSNKEGDDILLNLSDKEGQGDAINESDTADIVVYVAGEIQKPEVYTVPNGTRIQEIINLAGGITVDGDISGINLAQKVIDEQMITIPKQGEMINSTPTIIPTTTQGAISPNGKININKATKEELNSLPGIGEAYAQRIIDYRQTNGNFKDIEEITNVSGIGTKTFEKLKELIEIK